MEQFLRNIFCLNLYSTCLKKIVTNVSVKEELLKWMEYLKNNFNWKIFGLYFDIIYNNFY